MKIFNFSATTFYTGLNVSVRGTYVDERGYYVLSQKAVEIYRKKVEADPRLVEYTLHFVISESEPDKDGIFRVTRRTTREYGFEYKTVNSNIVLIEEKHFDK